MTNIYVVVYTYLRSVQAVPINHSLTFAFYLDLPSAPNNVNATFANQSAVELSWQPPEITGDQSHVFYDVDCLKPCNDDDGGKCVEVACGSNVGYIPGKEGLNDTQVMVTNLGPFVIYNFKIYARNRVSEVARRIHGVEGTFALITVRTEGSSKSLNEIDRLNR